MVEYTVAICNYNEADSLERSLQSVLRQVDNRFEVLVIDDGSTDGSVEILNRMDEEYEQLRVIALPRDRSRKLGRTRTISIEEANGNHVLLHVDTDNYYTESILSFVNIYEQMNSQLDFEFYLLSTSFAITKREFLLDFGPYRNLPVGGEDRDLWRRLAAEGKLICLKHESVEKLDGWIHSSNERGIKERIRRTIEIKTSDFQVGISALSYIKWAVNKKAYLIPFHLVTIGFSLLIALSREQYDTPEAFRQKGAIDAELEHRMRTLSELESEYDINIDRGQLSERGRQVFDV